MYLNVYEQDRHYGGPEEGGWYFTSYTPVGPTAGVEGSADRWRDNPLVLPILESLERRFPSGKGFGSCGSTQYRGGDYCVLIEDHPPRHQPEEWPHYE